MPDALRTWIGEQFGHDVSRAAVICDRVQPHWPSYLPKKSGSEPSADDLRSCFGRVAKQLEDQYSNLSDTAVFVHGSGDHIRHALNVLGAALSDLTPRENEEEVVKEGDSEWSPPFVRDVQIRPQVWVRIVVRTSEALVSLRKAISVDQVTYAALFSWMCQRNTELIAETLGPLGIETKAIPDPKEELREHLRGMGIMAVFYDD